jgi:hypothetical protein
VHKPYCECSGPDLAHTDRLLRLHNSVSCWGFNCRGCEASGTAKDDPRRGRDLGASIGVRARTEGQVGQEQLDRRAAAVMGGYAANAEELARLTTDGRPPS